MFKFPDLTLQQLYKRAAPLSVDSHETFIMIRKGCAGSHVPFDSILNLKNLSMASIPRPHNAYCGSANKAILYSAKVVL